jgi:glyoxylase-like metal-dependent hydrolase (beta-lactamase superfamily II)
MSSVKDSGKNTTTIPLPQAAKGPTIPAKGYLVEEIRDQLYWVTDGAYNTMFLVTDNDVIAVDAPATIGNNYLKAIAEVTNKPVTYVIYSHAHIDHTGAFGPSVI